MSEEQLSAALREMAAWNFTPGRSRRGARIWRGELVCRGTKVRIELRLSDWDFIDFPEIKVLAGVDVKALTPHIDASGALCYFQTGSIVLDRYRPATVLAQCLTQAQKLLERILFDPEFRRSEVQDEFEVHWLREDIDSLLLVLKGNLKAGAKSTNYWRIAVGKRKQVLLADNLEEAAALAKAMSAPPPAQTSCPCWLLESALLPLVPDAMPRSIKELFSWLKAWDQALYRRVQEILGKERSYLRFGLTSFAVKTPSGWLGFGFDLDRHLAASWKKRPTAYRQYLHGQGGTRPIFRLLISDVSADFIHSRNLTFSDLRDRHITVVGCGAIGSFVAQALVRLGAGSGSGALRLVDKEMLSAENLGRHVLGYPALFQQKAIALADELRRQFPLSRIVGIPTDVRAVTDLFSSDLVIDATGEEPVSEMLNDRRIVQGAATPLIHAWILGNGEAVQVLWADSLKYACYRCMRIINPDGTSGARFPVLKHEPERKQIGCHAFTPYAVYAPMQAASLVCEMIVDWLQTGKPSPRFRTRAAEHADVRLAKNQDAPALAHCPACRRAA